MYEERLKTLYGDVNWNVFRDNDGTLIDSEIYDSNYDENYGVETDKSMFDDDVGDVDSLFANNFDVDIDTVDEDNGELGDNEVVSDL